jgi:hypothetical protein
MTTKPTYIFIGLKDKPDWTKIVIEEPETNEFKKENQTIQWTTSKVYAKGPNGSKLPIYFQIAPQTIWGISGNWDMKLKKEDRTMDNIDGFQICYPMTTLDTKDDPTENEKITKSRFDKIWELTKDAGIKFCDLPEEDLKVPGPTSNSFAGAKDGGNWKRFIKPMYEHSMIVNEKTKRKTPDTTKPQKAYIKLDTRGKGKKLACGTIITGPGNKNVRPEVYMSTEDTPVMGNAEPVILWDEIYWGQHGTNPHGGSAKIKLSEMNFTPKSSFGPGIKMLGANTNADPSDSSSVDSDDPNAKFQPQKNIKESEGFKREDENPTHSGESSSDKCSKSTESSVSATSIPKVSSAKTQSIVDKRKALKEKKKNMSKHS